jgi:putative oxidoreductase
MKRGHSDPTTLASAGVLLLRVVVGVTFLLHGLDKLGDLSSAEQLFGSLGIPAPALMAPFVAVTETVGGALLIAGLATPLVAAALAVDTPLSSPSVLRGGGGVSGGVTEEKALGRGHQE